MTNTSKRKDRQYIPAGTKATVDRIDSKPLLRVMGLETHFASAMGPIRAVDGMDFSVRRGEIFGLVGESGCGKTVTALSILRLVPEPGEIVAGKILFDDLSLLDLTPNTMADVQGRRIAMIFQHPKASLNPVFTVGSQISELLAVHGMAVGREARLKTHELLQSVGVADPEGCVSAYPHQLSGGQAQRVMIATALALQPQLLIADEPTAALDVTIQSQILDLMVHLTDQNQMSVVLITHDLALIAETADRVGVMYAGHLVEQAEVYDLFDEPLHPYTQKLLESIPRMGRLKKRLSYIPGTMPNPVRLPGGCRFASRCEARRSFDLKICEREMPQWEPLKKHHWARCWLYVDGPDHHAPMSISISPK